MRALEFITGHVIDNPAYTYKFQLKTTIEGLGIFFFLINFQVHQGTLKQEKLYSTLHPVTGSWAL